jgi:hypothetical protein
LAEGPKNLVKGNKVCIQIKHNRVIISIPGSDLPEVH